MDITAPDSDVAYRSAKEHFRAGRLVQAEYLCLDLLRLRSDDSRALELLGRIAQRIGKFSIASACFRAAAQSAPGNSSLSARLTQATAAQSKRSERRKGRDAERYLLIKAWGYGFCSDLSQVLGALMLAEMTARTPVVHWGANSLFGGGATHDAFSQFFEPINDTTIDDLSSFDRSEYFPSKWSGKNLRTENCRKWEGRDSRMAGIYFFNKPERVAVCDFFVSVPELMQWLEKDDPYYGEPVEEVYARLAEKYLRPRAAIKSAVEEFSEKHLAEAPFVAAHVRGSDKIVEQADLNEVNKRYFDTVDGLLSGGDARIFLLSDCEAQVLAFQERYGERVVTTDATRTSSDVGVHYEKNEDPTRLGVELTQDLYVALKAKSFVGNGGSGPSCMITYLKRWAADDCVLLSPNMHFRRNPFLHFRGSPT